MQTDPDVAAGPKLIAYQLQELAPELLTAPVHREWMDKTHHHFANRCLPLRIANQAGWLVLNTEPVEAVWHGGDLTTDIEVFFEGQHPTLAPSSHFGYGVLTWSIPYLFRTPPGYNLIVRGPANCLKDGIVPLDGIVETDWSVATFTMNWKFTRPGMRVRFEAREPVCMIFPQKRHEVESFQAEILPVNKAPELDLKHQEWSASRDQFNREMKLAGASVPANLSWQKHYFLGTDTSGGKAPEHQLKLEICPFSGEKPVTAKSRHAGTLTSAAEAAGDSAIVIPRIVHQTWSSGDIPEKWRAYRESWKTHNPGWQFMFWTDMTGREFIATHYAWFLQMYDAYREPVMRADALRYFLLNHYGGVYADMDYECLKPFDAILPGRRFVAGCEPPEHAMSAEVRVSGLGWLISNALIGSVPGHEFWEHLFRQLMNARFYPGVLDATGPILLTRAYESFGNRSSMCLLDPAILSPITQSEGQSGRWLDPVFRQRVSERAWAVHHWDNSWVPPALPFPPLDSCPVHLLRNCRIVMKCTLRTEVLEEVDTPTEGPMISCMMVTRGRAGLAARSVACFRRQSYTNRELVILDDGEDPALRHEIALLNDPSIRFVALPPGDLTLGALRNLAVEESRGEYVAQWDDDDLSHPRRLELQMAALSNIGADASFLLRELIWWPQEKRLAISRRRVWESSILCRKEVLPAYPDRRRGEDTPVIGRLMRERRLALVDAPQLYVYVCHGANIFEADHFAQHWPAADFRFEGFDYERTLRSLEEFFLFSEYPVQAEALLNRFF